MMMGVKKTIVVDLRGQIRYSFNSKVDQKSLLDKVACLIERDCEAGIRFFKLRESVHYITDIICDMAPILN
jgi:hypothetical protein